MTLQEFWNQSGRDITSVARRTGNTANLCYVPLGHESVDDAVKKPLLLGNVNVSDLIANDWYVA